MQPTFAEIRLRTAGNSHDLPEDINMKKLISAVLALTMVFTLGAAAYAQDYFLLLSDAPVRTGPGLGYSQTGELSEGGTVEYVHQSAYDSRGVEWYRIRSGDGALGWVQGIYGELTDEPGDLPHVSYDAAPNFLPGEVTVSGNVNVRSGPGLGYEIVNMMSNGSVAAYLGSSHTDERGVVWYLVQYEASTGWVSSVYAQLSGGWENMYTTVEGASGDSNVRSGPGLGYESIGTLFIGDAALYLGASSVDERGVMWYCIRFGNQTGWVSEKYTLLY